jgi:hypothetical protein
LHDVLSSVSRVMLPPLPELASRRTSTSLHIGTATAIFVAELAAAWITARVDGASLLPTAIWIVALGVAGLCIVLVVERVAMRRGKALREGRLSPGWLVTLGTVAILIASLFWVLPLKMWVAEDGARQVANRLLSHPTCSTSSAALRSVGTLLTTKQVCAYGTEDAVYFVGNQVLDSSTGDMVNKGILYAPSGFGSGLGAITRTCVRRLIGPWWVYQDLILECPSGFVPMGGGP